MTRTRTISTTALVSLLGAAMPAFAQAPAPAPMYAPPAPAPAYAPAPAPAYAPAPAPAPMYAPAPAPMMAPALEPAAVMPVAPIVVPRSPDDMTGSVGFGVGVVDGGSLIKPTTTEVAMKYWMSDVMALVPRLEIGLGKVKDADATWGLRLGALASFVLLKGASTRLALGVGLGFGVSKLPVTTTGPTGPVTAVPADARLEIAVPVQLGVEHFFTRWFSMGLGAGFDAINFWKQGEPFGVNVSVNNVRYMGSLFIYTD